MTTLTFVQVGTRSANNLKTKQILSIKKQTKIEAYMNLSQGSEFNPDRHRVRAHQAYLNSFMLPIIRRRR